MNHDNLWAPWRTVYLRELKRKAEALGTTDLDIDGWGLDVVIGGSQKALMIPPGLAFASISERAWERLVRGGGTRPRQGSVAKPGAR